MEFKRLSDVEVVETPADNANILIEDNGVIKKTPKINTGNFIIINVPASVEEATCNKTYDEVIKMYCDGTIDCVIVKVIDPEGGAFLFVMVIEIVLLDANGNNTDATSVECIRFYCNDDMIIFYSKDGFSSKAPVGSPS